MVTGRPADRLTSRTTVRPASASSAQKSNAPPPPLLPPLPPPLGAAGVALTSLDAALVPLAFTAATVK